MQEQEYGRQYVQSKFYKIWAEGKVAFFAVVMSCNAIAGFSSAVKRVSLGTEASQRIFKVIDRIPKTSLKNVI